MNNKDSNKILLSKPTKIGHISAKVLISFYRNFNPGKNLESQNFVFCGSKLYFSLNV